MISTILCALLAQSAGQASDPAATAQAEALERWRARHGRHWEADLDPATGRAAFLWGGGERPARASGEGELVDRAIAAIAEAEPLIGIDAGELALDRVRLLPLGMVGGTDKWSVRFRQVVGGVPVSRGFVNALFDARGALLSLQTSGLPDLAGFDVAPVLSAEESIGRARAHFRAATGILPSALGAPRLVVAQIPRARRRGAVLAYEIDAFREEGQRVESLRLWIDARDGSLANSESRVHAFDVSGTLTTYASPGSQPDSTQNPSVEQPMPYAEVQADEGTVHTDANGDFVFQGVNTVHNVRARYRGTWCEVRVTHPSPAAAYVLNAGTLAGAGNTVRMNFFGGVVPPPNAITTPQANVYLAVNALRDWIRSVDPGDDTADQMTQANAVIYSAQCNGQYIGSVDADNIVFYWNRDAGGAPQSPECWNPGYSTFVAHEMGHWLNERYDTWNGYGMGEGNADVFALYSFDTRYFAEDLWGPATFARDGTNLTQFCGFDQEGQLNWGCNGNTHADGEVWMGTAWKIRQNLIVKYGAVNGRMRADALFLAWMNAYDQWQIHPVIEHQWLVLDDNDGTLFNGAPDWAEIDAAFVTHGFPGRSLCQPCFGTLALPPDADDPYGPYPLAAQIFSSGGGPVVNPRLHYRANASTWTSVAMTSTGPNTFGASIPSQNGSARVEHYFSAHDAAGSTQLEPDTTPDAVPGFWAGRFVTVLADDFETDQGWTVVNESVLAGAWERVDPIGGETQPEDDSPFGSGTRCWITGQATPGGSFDAHEVKGGPTRLLSPVRSLPSWLARVSYATWFANGDGTDTLAIEVSYDGGMTWAVMRAYTGGDGGWAQDGFVLDNPGAPLDQVRFRISVADDPDNSITEAAIDDFRVEALLAGSGNGFCAGDSSTAPCPCGNNSPAGSGAGCLHSLGAGGRLSAAGVASVANDTLVLFAEDLPATAPALYFQGTTRIAGGVGAPFGDGLRCAGGSVSRLGTKTSAAGASSYPEAGDRRVSVQGTIPAAGGLRFYQVWYRNAAAFCTAATFNLTNGLEVSWTP